MAEKGLYQKFDDAWILDGVRTPMVDHLGALADANPIDLGIKVARSLLAKAGVPASACDSVLAGNMAPGGFDHFYVPRHIGLYAGVPAEIPGILVQRICGTGFELFRQAGEQIATGAARVALLVGTESMTRHPISAYDHRGGFRLGAGVQFKDALWESLHDPAPGITMIQTAENLAKKYGVTRADADAFASRSFERAVSSQASGWFDAEIVPVESEAFGLDGYATRHLRLAGKHKSVQTDTHPRPSPVDALEKLRAVYPGGVQTAGNSSALTDAAAAALVGSKAAMQEWGGKPLGRLVAAAAVGVRPEIMGIGPAPAIRLLLERFGLPLSEIARFEINEAQAAQTIAVQRELGLDPEKLNVHGGAIALGHPLSATGVRLTVTVARELKAIGARYGIASACVGGGQGIALLIENAAA